MFCDRCGAKLVTQANTCPSCGKPTVPLMPPAKSIAGHVRMISILWLADAALHFLPALFLSALFSRRFFPSNVPPFVFNFIPIIEAFLMITGLAAALVGIGLLMHQSWARIAAMVLAAVNLINIPFGTALGIYTLWALLPADHEQEYRSLTPDRFPLRRIG